MKKTPYFICFFSFLSISCAKNINENLEDNDLISLNNVVTSSDIGSSFLSQGYFNMGHSFKKSCVNLDSKDYYDSEGDMTSSIMYKENLDENDFKKMFSTQNTLSVNSNISLNSDTVSAGMTPLELNYVRDASVKKLSKSVTYYSYVNLGEQNYGGLNNKISLLKEFDSYFDKSGNLIRPYDFVKNCGDELVASQKLSSKLMITVKLSFADERVLSQFNNKIGNLFIEHSGGALKLNSDFVIKNLSSDIQKKIRLNIYGVQLGGKPQKLINLLSLNTSCSLDKIPDCQGIFEKINNYIANDYMNQLDNKDKSSWYIENSKTVPYENLRILNSEGVLLNFNWAKNLENNFNLIKIKHKVNQEISNQIQNFNISKSMLISHDLATNERSKIFDISNKSVQNIQFLQNYSLRCYENIENCLSNPDGYLKYIETYDSSALKENVGKLINKVRIKNTPVPGYKHRFSEDFMDFNSVINSEQYTSIYFRFKDINNHSIERDSASISIKCHDPWYRVHDRVIFSGINQNYEILMDTVEKYYKKNCSSNGDAYIADVNDFTENEFIVEVWGK